MQIVEPSYKVMLSEIAREVVREQAAEHILNEWLQRMAEDLASDTVYEVCTRVVVLFCIVYMRCIQVLSFFEYYI